MQLQWRLLPPAEMTQVYRNEMVRDFPPEELKPLASILTMMEQGMCRSFGAFDGPRLAAYLLVVQPQGCPMALLDYFAVLPAYRAKGAGGALLTRLREMLADTDGVLIESEWPARAGDPVMARRRLGFYARAGAADTGWHDRAYDGYFNVLMLPCGPHAGEGPFGGCTADQAAAQLAHIYREMLPGDAYEREFELFRQGEMPKGRLRQV